MAASRFCISDEAEFGAGYCGLGVIYFNTCGIGVVEGIGEGVGHGHDWLEGHICLV